VGKATMVPITPSVLTWAIEESAYSPEEVAAKVGVTPAELEAWQRGKGTPPLTKFRKLASVLKRTPATFLLPARPAPSPYSVRFRHPPGAARTSLNPSERVALREAARLQEAAKWLARELGEEPNLLPEYSVETDPEEAADSVRSVLSSSGGVALGDWKTTARAFDGWRSRLESWGVLVFLFQMGRDSAQGFSLWDERVPLIAANTAWAEAARIFTLFHEVGHLLTRTNSVCVERAGPRFTKPTDLTERWCERFSAAVLLPWEAVSAFLQRRFGITPGTRVESLNVPQAIAGAFNVSLRAATLRLIERKMATWDLYGQIPRYSDDKPEGGGGGSGRDRQEIREDRFGRRATDLFLRALDRRVLTRADVLDYLDMTDGGLSRLQKRHVR
jgi:Zn-dependent peptidase ImmA (M78 family)